LGTSATELRKSTIVAQNKLGNYVRNGNLVEIEGANSTRLHHYCRLVFNVIFDTLSSAYPIVRKELGPNWKELVDRFFSSCDCRNYQVWRMPKEFLDYVVQGEKALLQKVPFLSDLLLFEWIEIELYSEEDIGLKGYSTKGDWETDKIVLNPHHRVIKLEYPVYSKNYDSMISLKGTYYLLVLRDLNELKVRFFELSPLFAQAIMQVEKNESLLLDSLFVVSSQFGKFDRETLKIKSQPTINMLFERNLILGFQN